MKYDPNKYHRRSIRLKRYDYSQAGAYFVTVVVYQRECLFGDVVDGTIVLNDLGRIVQSEWERSAEIRHEIELGTYVIMPNHFHGIVFFQNGNVGATGRSPLPPRGPMPKSLGALMAGFKSSVAKQINILRDTPGIPVWQRNYYEHIIRNDDDLNRIHRYIESNPSQWADDDENPANL